MASVVIAIYSVAVFCSYPLIVFPAVEILQKLIWSPDLPVTRFFFSSIYFFPIFSQSFFFFFFNIIEPEHGKKISSVSVLFV